VQETFLWSGVFLQSAQSQANLMFPGCTIGTVQGSIPVERCINGGPPCAIEIEDFSCTCGPCPSDIRLKKDIIYLGLENGFKIYKFRYVDEFAKSMGIVGQEFIGVMAQEVQKTHPHAVVQHPNGYLAVRYDLIGVQFMRSLACVHDGTL
jgi:hypothetical protein